MPDGGLVWEWDQLGFSLGLRSSIMGPYVSPIWANVRAREAEVA